MTGVAGLGVLVASCPVPPAGDRPVHEVIAAAGVAPAGVERLAVASGCKTRTNGSRAWVVQPLVTPEESVTVDFAIATDRPAADGGSLAGRA